MRAIERLVLAAALCVPAALPAWQDSFDQWHASIYGQLLQIDRPQGLAPAGPLDSDGNIATGAYIDGLWGRKVEAKLTGPLGWDGFSATLGTQSDFNSAGLTDVYLEWKSAAPGWDLRGGQVRLPLGWEQQLSSARLVTIQRALIFGFGNDGHLGPWGLGLLNERGFGLRADRGMVWAGGGADFQLGGFDTAGNGFQSAVLAAGRVGLRQAWGPVTAGAGLSGVVGRASLKSAPTTFLPLGQSDPAASWESGDALGGKGALSLLAADASVDLGPWHGRAELAWEQLVGWRQGGGQVTAWVDLPAWSALAPALYGRVEQAVTERPDGVHRPNSLVRAVTLGLSAPVGLGASLKLEAQRITDDDLSPFAGGDLYQAQLQWEL